MCHIPAIPGEEEGVQAGGVIAVRDVLVGRMQRRALAFDERQQLPQGKHGDGAYYEQQ